MSTRVAINGFGRIGRAVLRSAIERNADLDIVAVNDVADADTLAHVRRLDSVYGRFMHPVQTEYGDSSSPAGGSRSSPRRTRVRCCHGASSAPRS
jgi:glyceraldehyde 3-phosphate dehydrogenase